MMARRQEKLSLNIPGMCIVSFGYSFGHIKSFRHKGVIDGNDKNLFSSDCSK